MTTSDKYAVLALVGILGLCCTAGAETFGAMLGWGIPSIALSLFGSIKHYKEYQKELRDEHIR